MPCRIVVKLKNCRIVEQNSHNLDPDQDRIEPNTAYYTVQCQQLSPVLIVLELAPLTPRKIKRQQNHPGNS